MPVHNKTVVRRGKSWSAVRNTCIFLKRNRRSRVSGPFWVRGWIRVRDWTCYARTLIPLRRECFRALRNCAIVNILSPTNPRDLIVRGLRNDPFDPLNTCWQSVPCHDLHIIHHSAFSRNQISNDNLSASYTAPSLCIFQQPQDIISSKSRIY